MKIPSRSDAFDASTAKDSPSKLYSKPRIVKNVVVLSFGVHLLFTAYDGLTMLQSTMNREQGIGVISQAVLYVFFCISAVLFPKYVIKKFGSKATFAFSMLTYLPYVASNFYSHWILMIPTSILIGLGAALLWGSQAIYLSDIALMYSELIMNPRTNTKSRNDGTTRTVSPKSKCARSLSCDPSYFVIYGNDFNNVILKSYRSIDNMNRYSIPIDEPSGPLYLETGNIGQNADSGVVFQENEGMAYGSFKGCHENLNRSEKDIEAMNYGSFKSTDNILRNEKNLFSAKDEESSRQQEMANNRRKVIESTTARFFGFHGVAYLSSHITSNLMTYYILQSEVPEGSRSNSSCVCGADYCNVASTCFDENIAEPSDQIRYILTAACVCIGIVSVLIVFLFLDPLETDKEEVRFTTDLLMATCKLAKKKKLLLLIPFSLYIGMVQGFFSGDFTKSFVGCAWGTYHVGLVAVCYGAVCGLSSFSSGWLVRRLGRIPIMVTATLVNLAANAFLLSWSPSADQPLWFFVGAGLWGVFVGAIWSQLRAFYGVLFKADEEAAFAAFHVWYSLGFVLSFGYSNYICTSAKIYILISVCVAGFAGYLGVEILHMKNKARN